MKASDQKIPTALQHSILVRLGLALLSLAASICLFICHGSPTLAAPFLLAVLLLTGHAAYIHRLTAKGRCLKLGGTVLGVERSLLRGRPKAILLETQGIALRVILHSRLRAPAVGDAVVLYVPDTAPLYEWRGMHQLDSYLALTAGKPDQIAY